MNRGKKKKSTFCYAITSVYIGWPVNAESLEFHGDTLTNSHCYPVHPVILSDHQRGGGWGTQLRPRKLKGMKTGWQSQTLLSQSQSRATHFLFISAQPPSRAHARARESGRGGLFARLGRGVTCADHRAVGYFGRFLRMRMVSCLLWCFGRGNID